MLNRCEFIGNLGADPETRTFQNGGKVTNLRLAVSEKWKDRDTGERKERTEWVTVAVFGPLADVAAQYLSKGSKVYVAGKFTTRKWQDQSGQDRYSSEITLQGPQAQMVMLDGPSGDRSGGYDQSPAGGNDQSPQGDGYGAGGRPSRDLDDSIPFAAEVRI